MNGKLDILKMLVQDHSTQVVKNPLLDINMELLGIPDIRSKYKDIILYVRNCCDIPKMPPIDFMHLCRYKNIKICVECIQKRIL
jgi:hypothetical protein